MSAGTTSVLVLADVGIRRSPGSTSVLVRDDVGIRRTSGPEPNSRPERTGTATNGWSRGTRSRPVLRLRAAYRRDVPSSVLIVEDDTLIASSLARALGSQGYDVTTASTVAGALTSMDERRPDLVLLDLGLPDGDGVRVAEVVTHDHRGVPVIIVTARADELDVVVGLEAGAVDYVVKPFHLAELLARIRSHLRFAEQSLLTSPIGRRIVVGGLDVDGASRRVWLQNREIALRPKEFDLLTRLVCDAGTVVTRRQLIDDVWDENWWGSTKTLDVHINSIRRKLGEQPGEPSRIATIRGVGYRLRDDRTDRDDR